MRAAFVIFNRMTALDFVGVYDPLTRLRSMGFMPDFAWDLCSTGPNVSDDRGLLFQPTCVAESLAGYDLLIVPGGFDTRVLQHDTAFLDWLRAATPVPLKASVCTGSLLLGAAGLLRGRRATTHRSAFEQLRPYVDEVVDERVVDEGDVVTARGVTSAIDLGLHLVRRLAGEEVQRKIAQQMDYSIGRKET
jgi:transcriptional regulator GlxA family with amidase domain